MGCTDFKFSPFLGIIGIATGVKFVRCWLWTGFKAIIICPDCVVSFTPVPVATLTCTIVVPKVDKSCQQ